MALIICFRILEFRTRTSLIRNTQKTEEETENNKPGLRELVMLELLKTRPNDEKIDELVTCPLRPSTTIKPR